MKYSVASCILFTVLLAGCDYHTEIEERRSLDVWAVEATNDSAIRNAIIRQHTLFPYQFEQNGADLNDLGMRDAMVLSSHFKVYPGQLNIRQGTESRELYEMRVKKVVDYLDYVGVHTEKVTIKELPAGGDGMSAELVILILEADASGYSKPETGADPTDKPTLSGD